MKFNFPTVTCIDNELSFNDGNYVPIPREYSLSKNRHKLISFYAEILEEHKGTDNIKFGTDPLGFDYAILDFICYVGLIFIEQRSSKKNTNKKKHPQNRFTKDYIIHRIRDEHDLKNMNKFVPIKIFSQSLHELRGLNSKISGHVDGLMNLTDEESWTEQFDKSDERLKKIYVGSRLTKFILDNTRFFNPQYIESLRIDKQFRFIIHKSVFKIVKIYENDFTSDKTEIQFSGSSFRQLRGEREYFEILVKTLVENAIKFSTDKRIGPKIEIEDLEHNIVKLSISSYGRLIPEEERSDILTRGYRASVHEHIRGTGMGLFIAFSIAELYGIKLTYEAHEVSEDKSIKIGWNRFVLNCTETVGK